MKVIDGSTAPNVQYGTYLLYVTSFLFNVIVLFLFFIRINFNYCRSRGTHALKSGAHAACRRSHGEARAAVASTLSPVATTLRRTNIFYTRPFCLNCLILNSFVMWPQFALLWTIWNSVQIFLFRNITVFYVTLHFFLLRRWQKVTTSNKRMVQNIKFIN